MRLLEKLDRLAGWWIDKRTDCRIKRDPELSAAIGESRLRKFDQGEVTLVTPAAAILADGMAQMLNAAHAENYVQFDMLPRVDRGLRPIRVTVQWADGESPAAQNARLRDEIAQLRQLLDEANTNLRRIP